MKDIHDIEHDFKVLDGFVAFSAEIVRLALLSPAVFTFLIALSGEETTLKNFVKIVCPGRSWLIAALVFMALAVSLGLMHRYVATDFMSTYIEKKREGKNMKGDWRILWSKILIFAAPLCLLIGTSLLFISLFNIFWRE